MITIDTDESFEPRHVQMLLSHDEPFVAGLYCKKMPGLEWIYAPLDETKGNPFEGDPFNSPPLVEVARIARGFTSIHRSVFEALEPHCERYIEYASGTGKKEVEYWRTLPGGHSEDFDFCDRYRAIGGRIMVDRRIAVWHHGNIRFPIPETYQ